jgi:Raf kinase inhibitor-like YbhB/YbcL family protein
MATGRSARSVLSALGLVCAAVLGGLVAEAEPMAFTLDSPAFEPMGAIPRRYTCEGDDLSPELRWSGLPEGTRSLVLVVSDPDAPDPANPRTTWVHWVLYDIPPDAGGLDEGVAAAGLPPGTRQGRNDWKRTGYGGPCPPIGRHRYFFELHALDTALGDLGQATKSDVLRAAQGHILASAELVGTYEKAGR